MGIPKWDKSQTGMDHLRTSPGLVPNGQIALGSATVSPINMANGYATIANRGKVAEVYLIDNVVDRTGEVRYRHKNSTERVLDPDLADDTPYRSVDHTSELQSLMRLSYAVLCFTKN